MSTDPGLEPDRRDRRQRALRHLLQAQADYDADRGERDPSPVAVAGIRFRLEPVPREVFDRTVARARAAVASLRISPVEGDGGEPVVYGNRRVSLSGSGRDVFDADDFSTREGVQQ